MKAAECVLALPAATKQMNKGLTAPFTSIVEPPNPRGNNIVAVFRFFLLDARIGAR
jgi:hypothetical protein